MFCQNHMQLGYGAMYLPLMCNVDFYIQIVSFQCDLVMLDIYEPVFKPIITTFTMSQQTKHMGLHVFINVC